MRIFGVEEIVLRASSRLRGRGIGTVFVAEVDGAALKGMVRRALW